LRVPEDSATRPTTPITAARSTLGDGRASTTKPTSARPASTGLARSPTRSRRLEQQHGAR
jgi:hypothetical protein